MSLEDLTLPDHVELPDDIDPEDMPDIKVLSNTELTAAYMAIMQVFVELYGGGFATACMEAANDILPLMVDEQEAPDG